ncbi:MAG: DUF99 family protein [Deltaproteobacteria bacterium]|nr:MAG: DUF99 family protein [Deltaproteobacteria bacterium]
MPLPGPGRTLRVIGFDDVPWRHRRGGEVGLVGVVCATTRFEGMVYGAVRRDGWQATLTIEKLLTKSKFLPQIHLVLLDGIAFGGFNVVDLPRLARTLRRPCVAVMRKLPDLPAMERAAQRLPRPDARLAVLRRAGPIHVGGHFVYQVYGADPGETAAALERLTDTGHVPEALRLAHLIGGALAYGQSGRRA